MKKIFFLSLLIPSLLSSQKNLTGTVINSKGETLSGVTVSVEGDGEETITSQSGSFNITTRGSGDLLFSKDGFSSKSVHFEESTYTLNVTLNVEKKIIDDEKRTNSLRNVNTVSGLDFVEIIANRIAGAKIKKDFNGNKNITLRGRQSFKTTSDAVIWEINGMIYNAPPPMDISQIRYLEVLRDMASINKYGSLGGAGVIILKTEVTEKEYQSSRNLWNTPPPLTDEERKALKAEKKAKRLAKKAKKNKN
tara:strand:+ start:689 stop:1438 length:750 start_codon:yes stop_codon:yes gene_type:complete